MNKLTGATRIAAQLTRGFLSSLVRSSMALALAAGVTAPLALHADVIFSNVNDVCCSSIEIAGADFGVQEEAEAFTSTGNFSMTDAEVFISTPTGVGVDAFLYSNNSGAPGTDLGELGSDLYSQNGGFDIVTANSFTPIDLTAGTEYWLVLAPSAQNTGALWAINGSSSVPQAESTDGGSSWTTGTDSAQFQIDGTPLVSTPEPSSLPLLFGGAVCLFVAAYRARRNRSGA